MALPQLTEEQRAAALAKAAEARRVRAELKERLKRGGVSMTEVLQAVRLGRRARQDEGLRAARGHAGSGRCGPPRSWSGWRSRPRVVCAASVTASARRSWPTSRSERRPTQAGGGARRAGGARLSGSGAARRGRLIVLAGPSGVGKSSIVAALRARPPDLFFSVSATTRAPRVGEVDGARLPLRRQRGLRRADRARRPAGVGRDPRRPAAFRHTARARRARVGRRAARAGRGRPARRPRPARPPCRSRVTRVRRAPVARRARATAAGARHRVTRAVRPALQTAPRGVGGPRQSSTWRS